jgi:hypothetical protein
MSEARPEIAMVLTDSLHNEQAQANDSSGQHNPVNGDCAVFVFDEIHSVGEALPGKRITVQIDPEEQARYLAALPKVDPNPVHDHEEPKPKAADDATGKPGPAPASSYAWYWDKVPTGLGEAADRFDLALASLSDGPDGHGGRRATAATHAGCRGRIRQGHPARDAGHAGLARAGAGGDRDRKCGPVGCGQLGRSGGLMQLIPATAERFGVTDSTDPIQNIKGGVAYLDWLLKEFDNDPVMVLAAYNAGEGRGAGQFRRPALCRDAGLCAEGAGGLAGGAGALCQPADAGDGPLRVRARGETCGAEPLKFGES